LNKKVNDLKVFCIKNEVLLAI